MLFKVLPAIDRRYWTILALASICGTNLGDVFPDVFHLATRTSFLLLLLTFAALVVISRSLTKTVEVFYWLAILTVRAAATLVADVSVEAFQHRYLLVAGTAGLLLAGVVALRALLKRKEDNAQNSLISGLTGRGCSSQARSGQS